MKHVTVKNFRNDLPLSKIEVSEDNVRRTKQKAGLEDLKGSIKKYGLIQPVVVIEKNGKYDLIVGQRRYLAFLELGKTSIPAFIIEPLDKTSRKIVSFGENIQRRKLPYQDTIEACDFLYDKFTGSGSQKIKKIAEDMGISETTVKKYLARRIMPKKIQKYVDDEVISDDIAYRITSAHFPDTTKIISIIEKILKLTNSEKDRAADFGKRNPEASVKEILDYAKKPSKIL